MTILNRIVALLKGKTFQRVLSVTLCVCLCFSVFAKNFTKAEAAVGVSAGYAALSAYLQAGGIFMVVDAGGAAAASSAVAAATETAVAAGAVAGHTSASSVASAIAAGTTISASGAIILTVAAAALCAGIYAYWRSTLSDVGSQDLVLSDLTLGSLRLASGDLWGYGSYSAPDFSGYGTGFTSVGQSVSVADGVYLKLYELTDTYANFRFFDDDGDIVSYSISAGSPTSNYYLQFSCYYNNTYSSIDVSSAHPIYVFRAFNDYQDSTTYGPLLYLVGFVPDIGQYVRFQFSGNSSVRSGTFRPGFIQTVSPSIGSSQVYFSNPSGTVDIAIPDGKQTLTLPDVVPAGTTVDNFPDVVYQELANGSLTVGPPTVSNPPGYDEFDPPLPEQGPVEDPTNPGTDMPYLPGTLPIPWHYVERALAYAASFISLCVVTVNELIPSSVSDVIWAAVVLGILFGLIRRFLG